MTAYGELFVDEDCQECFSDTLNEWYGNGWRLVPSNTAGIYDPADIPVVIKALVMKGKKLLGKVTITVKREIEHDVSGNYYIGVEPDSIHKDM